MLSPRLFGDTYFSMCTTAQHEAIGPNYLDSGTHSSSPESSLTAGTTYTANRSFQHRILLPSPPCSPPRSDSDTASFVAFVSPEPTSITASMLQAPSTTATAKLDISLLLKSSPSPPPSSPGDGPRRGLLSRSSSVPPPSTQHFEPAPSSHRPSVSSSASVTTYQEQLQSAIRPRHSFAPQSPLPQQARSHHPILPPLSTPSFQTLHSSFNPHVPTASPHQQQLLPSPRHQPSAKRPPPSSPHPAASPAKRQSKWTPEEDTLIIELRGSGMKWEEISKRLPGRSAISCRLHYQNYLERRSEWDEERKNRLARLYER